MIPVEVKKRENIAEYIIHMYQTEDLISSFAFNLNDIQQYVLQHMSKDEDEIKALLLWYADIIDQMQREKLPARGRRLAATQAYVAKLSNLHNGLLQDSEEYRSLHATIESDINEQMKLSQGQVNDPIQVCLNAVYGRLVINLNGKKLPAEHEKMVEKFGQLLAFLTHKYHASE
jgi:hypothetical protein